MTTHTPPNTEAHSPVFSPRSYLELFLISFAILFFELACIRWFGSTVVFMTFFTNIVLMACFLGMTVGCLTASRKQSFITLIIPLALLTVVLAQAVLLAYFQFGEFMIDVGGQGSPQQIYFGTESRSHDLSRFVLPIEAVAGLFYVLIALMFVGLGQVMGRAFNAIPNHIAAYTANIFGSLVGIAAFGAASYFQTTPVLWFAVSLGIGLYFVNRRKPLQVLAFIGVLAVMALAPYSEGESQTRWFWSPYYKIRYDPQSGTIRTNNIGHQTMMRSGELVLGYALPHLLDRGAGGRPFADMVVIG